KDSAIELGSIVHLFSHDADDGASESREAIERAQNLGLFSVLSLVQALAALEFASPLRLLAVSSHAQTIHGDENCACAKAPLSGLLLSINQELPWLRCLHLDCPGESGRGYAAAVVRELLGPSGDQEIAYRGNQRLVSGLQRVDIPAQPGVTRPGLPFRRRGFYILDNGLEGIGPHLAEFLLTKFEARLLLLGKDLPSTDRQRQGQAAERLATFDRLQQLAGDCAYASVDIQDPGDLARALEPWLAPWGSTPDGVIHLAAVPPEGALLAQSQNTLSATFAAEAARVWSLSEFCRKHPNSLFIILSSATDFADSGGRCALAASAAFQHALISRLQKHSSVRAHGFSLASWHDLAAPHETTNHEAAPVQAAVSVRRAINSILLGLQLGEGRLLIGLDEASPLIRARLFDGPLQCQKTTIFFTADRTLPRERLCELPLVDRYGSMARCDYVQMREPDSAASEQVELWPSVAEYFV
ncbi:MAG TPA: KR domain-containing protein, partial [Steroidobacteraceae bacterium]